MEIIEKMRNLDDLITELVEDVASVTSIQHKEEMKTILGSLIEDLIELDNQLSVLE